jgi:ABC-2 type transport system ATP-binding protein
MGSQMTQARDMTPHEATGGDSAIRNPQSAIAPPALAVAQVSRWYGDVVAVSDVTFNVRGGITGLLGPNGAGKTTLLKMLAGLLAPSRGEVRVLGEPVRGNPAIYRRISLVMEQEAVYPFMTAREFVRFNAHLQGIKDERTVERALDEVELLSVAERTVGGFSKGMKQRVKLAAALVHQPPVLLLDEPFSGTDPRQRMHLMALLRRWADEGRTVLFSSHILEEVEQLAQDVVVIVAGKLAALGGIRGIRAAMLDRPHLIRIRAGEPRLLAAALIQEPTVAGVTLAEDGALTVQARELGGCALAIPRLAREHDVRLLEVAPEDESLESVFAYLVGR